MNATLEPDVLVIGAGPAGIAAAVRAAQAGRTVTVLDDNPATGGQIWRGGVRDSLSKRWFAGFESAAIPTVLDARAIWADGSAKTVLVEATDSPMEIRFKKVILATGARELFLPFPGWTLPGVFGVGGLQALVKSGVPVKGKRIVLAGSGPLLVAAAAYLKRRGADVVLVAEQAPARKLLRFGWELRRSAAKLRQAVALGFALAGVRYLPGCWVESAEGAGRVERVRLSRGGTTWTEACDYAAVAYGLWPNTELAALLGCRVTGKGIEVDQLQTTSAPDILAAGECTGIGGVDLSLVEGEIAGHAAAGENDAARQLFPRRAREQRFAAVLDVAFALRQELRRLPRPDTLVCRCEDVAFSRLESFRSFRAARLQTRCGMGACQARICGPATELLFGWQAGSVRPPILPARVGTLAVVQSSSDGGT